MSTINANIDVPLGEPLERRVERSLQKIFNTYLKTEGRDADLAALERANELHVLATALAFAGYRLPVRISRELFDRARLLVPDGGGRRELGALLTAILEIDGVSKELPRYH